MKAETKDISMLERDILEWDIPEEVLAVLLKDRTTGRNLIWATDDYAERGKGFAAAAYCVMVDKSASRSWTPLKS